MAEVAPQPILVPEPLAPVVVPVEAVKSQGESTAPVDIPEVKSEELVKDESAPAEEVKSEDSVKEESPAPAEEVKSEETPVCELIDDLEWYFN